MQSSDGKLIKAVIQVVSGSEWSRSSRQRAKTAHILSHTNLQRNFSWLNKSKGRQSSKEMQSSRKWTEIVRCLVYWWTKHWVWFEKRREEKSPKRGWTFCERMSPSCSGISRPGIQAEKDRQTIQDLHMAIKRRSTLKRGNKRWWGSPRQWCMLSSRRLLVQECAGARVGSEMMTYIFTLVWIQDPFWLPDIVRVEKKIGGDGCRDYDNDLLPLVYHSVIEKILGDGIGWG